MRANNHCTVLPQVLGLRGELESKGSALQSLQADMKALQVKSSLGKRLSAWAPREHCLAGRAP